MSISSAASSTELPPAQSWMKAQLQADEHKPQLVCFYCILQVSLEFLSEQRPFCFSSHFGDAMATVTSVIYFLSKMRHFYLSRLWKWEENLQSFSLCTQPVTQQSISVFLLHIYGSVFLISGRSLIFLFQFLNLSFFCHRAKLKKKSSGCARKSRLLKYIFFSVMLEKLITYTVNILASESLLDYSQEYRTNEGTGKNCGEEIKNYNP